MKCVTRARGEVYRRGLHAERITHGEGEIIGAGKMQGRAGNDLNCHYLVDQKKRDADRWSTLVMLVRFVPGTIGEGVHAEHGSRLNNGLDAGYAQPKFGKYRWSGRLCTRGNNGWRFLRFQGRSCYRARGYNGPVPVKASMRRFCCALIVSRCFFFFSFFFFFLLLFRFRSLLPFLFLVWEIFLDRVLKLSPLLFFSPLVARYLTKDLVYEREREEARRKNWWALNREEPQTASGRW